MLLEPMKLLIIDDDAVDRAGIRRMLAGAMTEAQVSVVEVDKAEDALEALRRDAFDCALLDFRLPGHDGLWVLEQARTAGVRTPIIVLTGQGDEQIAVELMKAGAADYFPKGSLATEILVRRIADVIRVARAEEESHSARVAQRQSEEILRLTVDSVPALIAYVGADQRYRWNNLQYQTWFAQPRGELAGRHLAEVLGPEAYESVRPRVERALAGSSVSFEQQISSPTGTRWAAVTYEPHRSATGEITGFVSLVHDISDRKRQEEQARKQAEFEQQLVGIVSHDLRNPIAAILMNTTLLLRSKELAASAAKPLARIVSSSERAARLIRDLLDFTQARVGGGIPVERRPADMHELATQAIEELRASYPEREIAFEPGDDGRGEWDPDRVGQILGNLLSNALAYSPKQSPVTVRVGGDANSVRVEVHNHGDPIAADVLANLFVPFKRSAREHEPQRSIGLGLFIVRQLVLAHGGSVDVRSEPEHGTTCRVLLPRR